MMVFTVVIRKQTRHNSQKAATACRNESFLTKENAHSYFKEKFRGLRQKIQTKLNKQTMTLKWNVKHNDDFVLIQVAFRDL